MNDKLYKIDLHTHSIISYDGGISAKQYEKLLVSGILDVIAITDHNQTTLARVLHKQFGEKIIVGEEIMSKGGEIIGLFLEETIAPNRSVLETVKEIELQGGLVYIPHPLEKFRKGLQSDSLESIAAMIAIIEVFNGRGRFGNKNKLAQHFAEKHRLAMAASSDSHSRWGIGQTFSTVSHLPNKKNLVELLQMGSVQRTYAPLLSYLSPTFNKIKNKIILTEKLNTND